MKRLTAFIGAIVIASSTFIGCGGSKGNGDLTVEENDIVKAVIAIGCNDTYSGMSGVSMNNKEALKKYSVDLSPLVEKYMKLNWHFDIYIQSSVSFSADNNGQLLIDFVASIPKDGFFLGRCNDGGKVYEIKFIEGKVGLNSGNVYIEEGTRLLLNDVPFIYKDNSWKKEQKK